MVRKNSFMKTDGKGISTQAYFLWRHITNIRSTQWWRHI